MSKKQKVIGIIPARYESTRFPGKPLAKINGKPMICLVAEAAASAREIDEVYVATDDKRIVKAVQGGEAEAVMTPPDLASGSDRVATVARQKEADIVVNIQGDEPLIKGEDLDRGIRALQQFPELPAASFKAPCPVEEFQNPDVVKVVVDNKNRALYFSRAPIPHRRGEQVEIYQHIGIYVFRKEALLTFTRRQPTLLERTEKLEQLRFLENGESILMVDLAEATVGVDRPEDIEKVEKLL